MTKEAISSLQLFGFSLGLQEARLLDMFAKLEHCKLKRFITK